MTFRLKIGERITDGETVLYASSVDQDAVFIIVRMHHDLCVVGELAVADVNDIGKVLCGGEALAAKPAVIACFDKTLCGGDRTEVAVEPYLVDVMLAADFYDDRRDKDAGMDMMVRVGVVDLKTGFLDLIHLSGEFLVHSFLLNF